MKSALIYVASPLQAISAIEAIINYGIDNYRLIVLDDGTSRQKQIEFFLTARNAEFEVLAFEKEIGSILSHFVNLAKVSSVHYDYLFIGDYRNIALKMNHLKDIKRGGKIIYLDDGNFVVSLFKNKYKKNCWTKINYLIADLIVLVKNISDYNFFTIFDDIQSRRYHIDSNRMTCLYLSNNKSDDTIYIIGTNVQSYCNDLGISEDTFVQHYIDIIHFIKKRYANKDIVYIPHGRDKTEMIKKATEHLGVKYLLLDKCVELYFIENGIYPLALYGFGSTALFTLKKTYPALAVYNIFEEGSKKNGNTAYQEINRYYAEHDIIEINIQH